MTIEYINPDGMFKSPVFSQGIIVPPNARMLYIGGQNGVDENNQVIHSTDVGKQSEQAIANMVKVLQAARATLEDLVKVTVILQQDADLQAAYRPWMTTWANRPNPPIVTALRVPGLARPDYLIEIEAQAVLR